VRTIRQHSVEALREHVTREDAVKAYDTLMRHVRNGSLRAAVEWLRMFAGLDGSEAKALIGQNVTIKIINGVDRDRL
jgi:hypothetical protein